MTAMARRRPITSHPAFAPIIALWFAALFGLTLAVLPAASLEAVLSATGLGGPGSLTTAARVIASAAAATGGALLGYAVARTLTRRAGGDPRPVYAEDETGPQEARDEAPVRRRPLHVREELAGGFGDESQVVPGAMEPVPVAPSAAASVFDAQAPAQEGFMILTPQPIHPPRPEPDLEALLDQFDSAFAAFRAGEGGQAAADGPGADPVQAFVARQTGAPPPSPGASPMGGLVPDHQAELRAALDKLARSQRKK